MKKMATGDASEQRDEDDYIKFCEAKFRELDRAIRRVRAHIKLLEVRMKAERLVEVGRRAYRRAGMGETDPTGGVKR
jgi:prefoldin subunit 5